MELEYLHIQQLTLKRGKRTILNAVELHLAPNDIVGIIGKNGSGKSSLLQVLFGSLRAQSITMSYNGYKATPSKNNHNRIFGYLPQDPFTFNNLTVNETIATWFPDTLDQDRLLYEPLIHTLYNKRVGNLSMGERRFLECMLVMNQEQPVILLDEPFSALAPLQIERAIAFIKERRAYKAIVITDHYYQHVLKTVDKNLLLHDGKLTPTNQMQLVEKGYLPASTFQ